MQEGGRIASGGEKRLTMRFAASFLLCTTLKATLADDKVSEGEATRIKKMLEDMPDKE